MFELIKLILELVRGFINKYFPILSEALTEIAEILGLIKSNDYKDLNTVIDISDYVEVKDPEYSNDFFSSKEEEEKYFIDLASFSSKHNLIPELVYYMFCCDKKVNGTRLDNEMKGFLSKDENVENFLSLLSDYPKLRDLIIVDGSVDMKHSKKFNKYIRDIIFEPDPNFNCARYTPYFFKLTKN